MRSFPFVAVFVLTLAWSSAVTASPQVVPVTACGQTIPRGTIGYLTGDLDCTSLADIQHAAVYVDRGGRLDLQGFTLRGGGYGVWCGPSTFDSPTYSLGKCRIVGAGGFIEDSYFEGVVAEGLVASNVTIRNAGGSGITATNTLKLGAVTLTGNAGNGANSLGGLRAFASTVTGNGFVGLESIRKMKLIDTTVVDNGLNPQCGPYECVDLLSYRRPSLKNSVCEWSLNGSDNQSWGVCTAD